MTQIQKTSKFPKEGFAVVPVGTASLMKGNEYKVYTTLLGYVDKKTLKCFPSTSLISKLCGIDRSNVSKIITKLQKDGWIERKRRMSNSSVYKVFYPEKNLKKEAENSGNYKCVPIIKSSSLETEQSMNTSSNEFVPIAQLWEGDLPF